MKKITGIVLTFVMLLSVPFPGNAGLAAGKEDVRVYTFDNRKTAEQQLEDLFTTIDIMDATIEDLSREMEAGNVTSEQLTQMYIDRIQAYDGKLKLNSIISINPYALEEARKLDKERLNGKIRGPLHGIPILVKDNIDVAKNVTSGGSLALANMVVNNDAFVVEKLKKAGAVIVAKSNLSEFASSAVDSKSLLGGTVHNAYDTSRVPAGSSGGTGVAVTSNFAAAGLGTDTGGSIRNPSSYSNLYGIRPSKGLTSTDGVIPLTGPRDTVGPMARTAQDMALLLEVIGGTDAKDDFTEEAGADQLLGSGYMASLSKDGLKGKRIGYLTSSFAFDRSPYYSAEELEQMGLDSSILLPDAKVEAMIEKTRANLRKAGAGFVDLSSQLKDSDIYNEEEGGMSAGASDDTTEYDFNKYLSEKGEAAPYKTLKALYKSGRVGIDFTNLPVWSNEQAENMADSFSETPNPYKTNINNYLRGETWQQTLEGRKKVMDIMEENNIDAIMYIASFDVVPTYANLKEELKLNNMGWVYGFTFGPALGMPEVVIPMGFSDPTPEFTRELPLGMRLFGKFGDEKTLMQIAYAYEQQAGDSIRKMPENSPALEDKNMEAYLEALIDETSSIDYDQYNKKPEAKVKLMEQACLSAASVDSSDPYVCYKAASKLAQRYDKVMAALKASGRKEEESGTKEKTPDQPAAKKVLVKTVKLTGISKKIAAGNEFRLKAKILPAKAGNKKLQWKTSNKKIATVNQNGLVKIKKKTGGKTVKITAAATDGSGVKAVWKIQVMKGVVKKITIKKPRKSLKVGKTMKLTAQVSVSKGRPVNRKLKWTSSNSKWAVVDSSGKVKALKAGKGKIVKITAQALDGSKKKKTIQIKIKGQ